MYFSPKNVEFANFGGRVQAVADMHTLPTVWDDNCGTLILLATGGWPKQSVIKGAASARSKRNQRLAK